VGKRADLKEADSKGALFSAAVRFWHIRCNRNFHGAFDKVLGNFNGVIDAYAHFQPKLP
jgi:hypothetical protein